MDETNQQVQVAESPPRENKWKKGAAGIISGVVFLIAKGKLLLLGLTKLSTLVSMFGFFAVYWGLYGWAFALGLVLSIYVHEMGHVIALRHYGIPASAPMFIPGLGAFIRMRALSISRVQDSRVGLAGPIYGFGAALAALLAYEITRAPSWAAIAHATAVMNLFNLIPIWQLDGGRGVHSLTRGQRMILLAVCAGIWLVTRQGMLLLVGAGLAYRLFTRDDAPEPDNTALMQFAGLLVALATVVEFASLL